MDTLSIDELAHIHELLKNKKLTKLQEFFIDGYIQGGHFVDVVNFIQSMDKPWPFDYSFLDESDKLFVKKLKSTYPWKLKKKFQTIRNQILCEEQQDPQIKEWKYRLLKSVYPYQTNDFIFLSLPENIGKNTLISRKYFRGECEKCESNCFHDATGTEIPCDWQLSEIVKFLWQHNYHANGWDVRNTGEVWIEIVGKITCDSGYLDRLEINGLKEIFIDDNLVQIDKNSISFYLVNLNKISKQLGLKIPKEKDAIPGGLIPFYHP